MEQFSRLLTLDGHGIFVWGAWLPCLALLLAEAWLVRARVARARRAAADRSAEDAE